jgi:hypothetical protein
VLKSFLLQEQVAGLKPSSFALLLCFKNIMKQLQAELNLPEMLWMEWLCFEVRAS